MKRQLVFNVFYLISFIVASFYFKGFLRDVCLMSIGASFFETLDAVEELFFNRDDHSNNKEVRRWRTAKE